MYDTFGTWKGAESLKNSGYLQRIPAILTNATHSVRNNGIEYYTGHCENLHISVSENGLSIKGSLNKFWHNDNFNKLTRQETEHSFEKLQDILLVNLQDAEMRRLDIAGNFMMKQEVSNYYHFLGDCKYYKRLNQADSIYYNNGLRSKLFYNKVKEGKVKGLEIPQIWQDRNVLRYELRFMKRLPKQFKMNQVLVSDLFSETFYQNAIDAWLKEYQDIKKNRLLTPNIENKMTSREAKEYLLSALIETVGQNEVNKLADQWKENFSTLKEAQRFKKSLQDLKGLNEESPLMAELDAKILRVKQFYR